MPSPLADEIWALSEGAAGMRAQALGLAERLAARLGLTAVEKTVRDRFPFSLVAPYLRLPGVMGLGAGGDPMAPPWPRILVSCGRHAVAPALEAKRRSGGRAFAVHVQNPLGGHRRFDLIVAPEHDRLRGANVLTTTGAIHRVTPTRLAEAAAAWADRLAALPSPRVAVILGGSNRAYRLGPAEGARLGADLARLARDTGGSLMVTPSRRTGEGARAAIARHLDGIAHMLWDMTGENPYFGFLGLADAVLVTCDSVSMVSEACLTGKPVHILPLPGTRTAKFDRFHARMRAAGFTRPFEGHLETWTYTPLDETGRAAQAVIARLDKPAASR